MRANSTTTTQSWLAKINKRTDEQFVPHLSKLSAGIERSRILKWHSAYKEGKQQQMQ